MEKRAPGKCILVILDGFGHREAREGNAIAAARMPNWRRLNACNPHTLIDASGEAVGLPTGQMGNSEVGHMVMGAGRAPPQDLVRIDQAVADGDLARHPRLDSLFQYLRASGGALHVMGLLSPGGVHAHESHLLDAIRAARQAGVGAVYLHAFLDGRDTPPKSARPSLASAEALFQRLGGGQIASICGRYHAMDRDQRWERTETAWRAIVQREAQQQSVDSISALEAAYERGESDEFVTPTLIQSQGAGNGSPSNTELCIAGERDAVLFMNFRADRARQLSNALFDADFSAFPRPGFKPVSGLTLTQYAKDAAVACLFEPPDLTNTLGEVLATAGLRQLRAAESEKYAHVTYFFSGGRETPFAGEERLLIPSPKAPTYDLTPAMSARELTDGIVAAIKSGRTDAIICNYANGDMVGHTGNFKAAVAAVEVLDECLGHLAEATAAAGWSMLVTADHGNVEQMQDAETRQPHTAHTAELVPCLVSGWAGNGLRAGGTLADIAPTTLELLGVPAPAEMAGRSLLQAAPAASARKQALADDHTAA